ncbi:MAG: hypothetical protein CSA74_11125 [Rhodobacterales bacterium]|nr:MAG: hypothetical protein CSA74_11125 [Rhodobacterales bacterium]
MWNGSRAISKTTRKTRNAASARTRWSQSGSDTRSSRGNLSLLSNSCKPERGLGRSRRRKLLEPVSPFLAGSYIGWEAWMKPTTGHFTGLICLGFLAGCASTPHSAFTQLEQMSTSALWTRHLTAADQVELLAIEAELGMRGETQNGYNFLGNQTLSVAQSSRFARSASNTIDMNCDDFASSAQAQKFFLQNGGPQHDPAGLDRDGDGLACEWGTELRKIRETAHPPTYRRPTYTPRCHTGPRGGRYTITASGRKNYGGC